MKPVWILAAFGALACSATTSGSSSGAPPPTQSVRVAMSPNETVEITRENDVRTLQLTAPRAQVWSALMATHDALGTTPSVVDAGAGNASFVHQNSRRLFGKPLSAWVDCGRSTSGPRADTYSVTIRVNHVLRGRGDNEATLHTVVTAWARPTGMTGDPVQCFTIGSLERKIGEILQTRLQS